MTGRVVLSDTSSVIIDIAPCFARSIKLMQEGLEAMSEPTNGTVKLPKWSPDCGHRRLGGPSGSIDRLMLAIGIRRLFAGLGDSLAALHCAFAASARRTRSRSGVMM